MTRAFHFLAVLVFFLASAATASSQSSDLSGDWELTVQSPQGARNVKVSFKQAGEKLTGSLQTSAGGVPIDGTVKGSDVQFSFTIERAGGALAIKMTGRLEGGELKGQADFGGLGQGEWSGRRESEAATAAPAPVPAAGPAGALAGDWEVTINSPQGKSVSTVTVAQQEDKLTGVIKGASGQTPIQGTAVGGEVKFAFTIQFQGNPLPITLTGKAEGDAIKGQADFGGFAQGDWSAKRVAAGAAAAAAPPAPAAAASSGRADVTGTWQFQVETSAGSGAPTFVLKQDGEQLSGTYKGIFGELPVSGTVKGNAITISIKVKTPDIEATLAYTGTVEAGGMKGTVTLGDLGSGTWTAKRQN